MFWDTTVADSSSCDNCNNSRMAKQLFADKENSPSAKFDTDLSMYESNSPGRMSCDGSPLQCSFTINRRSSELTDHNSQDSGYSASDSAKFSSPKSRGLSFGSATSMEEEFLDISALDVEDENSQLPGDFNKLITGSLALNNESPEMVIAKPTFRRALSMINSASPNTSKARSCLFKAYNESESRNFKRPEPPTELQSPVNTKRSRIFSKVQRQPAKTIFQRSFSASEDTIKTALQRSSTEPDLIGDFSKAFCLPLITGRHQDLKSITPTTLSQLMNGEYNDSVASYKIIDCRYPYEFEGGHIMGAQNIYTKQNILDELLNNKEKNAQPEVVGVKRHILVFHCEFSSERGPNLSRYLRNIDRSQNIDFYPMLHYPEVYLLDGGYKNFFESFADMCAPNGYLPMLHPEHEENLRHFRAKSKTWNSDVKSVKSSVRSFRRL